jgi:glycerol-3-phosphate acyltransferase PlsY
MTTTAALTLGVWILPELGFEPSGFSLKIFTILIFLFIIFTHRSNIGRLRKGIENKFEKAVLFKSMKRKP